MGQGTVVVRTNEGGGGSLSQHIDSLRMLLELDLKVILSGHGPVMHDPLAKIPELVRNRLEVDERILGIFQEVTEEVDALVARIYGETNERLRFLARHLVVAHLKKLEEDGRAFAVEPASSYRAIWARLGEYFRDASGV